MGNFFSDLFKRRERLNVSRFNHPLCHRTEWGRLKWGGTSFQSHVLQSTEEGNMVFAPSWKAYLMPLIPLAFFVFIAFKTQLFSNLQQTSPSFLLLPLVALGISVFIGYRNFKKSSFDFLNGIYWKGYRAPASSDEIGKRKNCAYIKDIGGLQIIRERIRSRNSNYTSFELNLVLKDGSRLNVIDHSNLSNLRKEAKRLAARLNVPLWDASDYRT